MVCMGMRLIGKSVMCLVDSVKSYMLVVTGVDRFSCSQVEPIAMYIVDTNILSLLMRYF